MNTSLINKSFRWVLYLQILINASAVAQWAPLQYPGVIGGDFPVINAMDFVTATTGVAVSDDGLIVRTTNGGVNWDTVYTIPNTYTFKDIIFFSDANAVAVGHKTIDPGCISTPYQGIIALSTDNGLNWDTTSVDFNLNAVDFPTAQIGYIGGDCGRILKTINAGDNWTEILNTGTVENIKSVACPSELVGYFSFTNGDILKTTTGADTWETVSTGINTTGYIQFFNDLEGVTVSIDITSDYKILATENGGESWTGFTPFAGNELIYMFDQTRGYSGPAGGSLIAYISESGGSINFQQALPPAPETGILKRTIHFFNETIGYAAGANTFYRLQIPKHYLTGKLYDDQNSDCILMAGEPGLKDWIIKVEKQGVPSIFKYTTTDINGTYDFTVDTGNYVLSVFPPNNTRGLCDNDVEIDLTLPEGSTVFVFGSQIDSLCPVMEIDIATPILSRCKNNSYYVVYKNKGTAIAENPHITLLFDDDLEVISSTPDWTDASGGLFTYNLEDLMPGDSGIIELEVLLDCESTIEGQTHGVIAKVFPDNICDPLDSAWDQSSVQVSAACTEDSLTFQIKNIGSEDMQNTLEYIVIEDHILLQRGNFDLDTNQDSTFVFYPNGGTLRLEADQSEGHPGRSLPSVAIEGCGSDENGNFSLGFITQDPENDLNSFISIEYQESIDTGNINLQNQIFAYPKGFGNDHYIKPNTSIEYRIPFEVPFVIPANNYRILTIPSPFQEMGTVIPGVSSHAYDFFITGADSVQFVIAEDLFAGDVGFIKFRIDQKPDNTNGTPILNQFIIDIPVVDSILSMGSYLHNVSTDSLASSEVVIVSGNLVNSFGIPLENATIVIDENTVATSDINGIYQMSISGYNSQNSLILEASKASNLPEGTSAYDLFLLNEYLNGQFLPDNPFQLLAADWDANKQIDHDDLFSIQQMIGKTNQSDAIFNWRFVPSNYNLDTNDPLSIPNGYLINHPVLNNIADFKGVKLGDFDLSSRSNNTNPDTISLPILEIAIQNQQLNTGERYDIPFVFNDLNGDILSFQWMLHYDANQIEVLDILPGLLNADPTDKNLQLSHSDPGIVIITWYRNNAEMPQDSLAFQLRIKANEDLNLIEVWVPENELLFPEAFIKGESGIVQKFKVLLGQDTGVDFSGILNVTPNPGRGIVSVNYQLDQNQKIKLRLFNALGQLVRFYENEYIINGNNQLYVDASTLSSGVYFLYLEGEDSKIKAMKKLTLIN